jgi:Cdc6-like AAA superfamily ATPase
VERESKKSSNPDNFKNFDFLYINGMKVTNPQNVFKIIYDKIFNEKRGKDIKTCIFSLEQYFKNRKNYIFNNHANVRNPTPSHLLLVVDEIDCLITQKQALLYNIFNWTTYPESRLIVISISNNLDLPEKLSSKIASRIGTNRLIFKPYQKDQLFEILKARVDKIELFTVDALRLSAMKVAAISGDLRRILQICSRAKEIFEQDIKRPDQIGVSYIKRAIEELFDSKTVMVMKQLKKFEKILLLSILIDMKINSINRVFIEPLFSRQDFVSYKYNNTPGMSFDQFRSVIFNLVKLKIINFSEPVSDNFISNSVYVKFFIDEFTCAVDEDSGFQNIIQEHLN